MLQGDQWCDGADLTLCPKFAEVVSSLALIPIAERKVEAQHAKTQKGSKKSPHHSPAYMSLQLRGRELRGHMTSKPQELVAALAPFVYQCRSYKKAAESMKLTKHPRIVNGIRDKPDKLLRDALYRADPASQHHRLPQVFAQDPRSRGPRALPPTEVLDNSSIRGVLQQLALEHVFEQVQAVHSADGADPVFAVRYEVRSFALLREFLLPATAHSSSGAGAALSDDVRSEALALVESSNPATTEADVLFQKLRLAENRSGEVNMMFFKLLPSMHQMKRFQAEGEHQLRASDLPVALMRLLSVDIASRECLVDSELLSMRTLPAGLSVDDVPCVMSISNMSLEQLRSLAVMKVHEGVVYTLRSVPDLGDMPVPDSVCVLQNILKQVCECGKEGLPDVSSFSAHEKMLLEALRAQGIMTQDLPLRLTAEGSQQLVLATRISSPQPLLASSDSHPSELSRWQLLHKLIEDGWEVRVCNLSDCRKMPSYKRAVADKVLFLPKSSGSVICSHVYLLALALHDEHMLPVPHGRSNSVYTGLIQGLEHVPAKFRKTRAFRAVCEGSDWQEDEPAPRRQRGRPARRALVVPEREEAVADEPEAMALHDGGADVDAGNAAPDDGGPERGSREEILWLLDQFDDSDDAGADANVGSDAPAEAASPREGSDRDAEGSNESASSSSSSSSSGSSSSSSSSSSSAAAAAPKPRAKPKAVAARMGGGALLDTTFFWRGCKFTATRDSDRSEIGFEVSCKHPGHIVPGKAKCRRTLKFAPNGGREKVILMLKWWCLQAGRFSSKDEHVNRCPKCFDDPAPTAEQLDAAPFGFGD